LKKNKQPLVLKIIRALFPVLEKVAPAVARRLFVQIFFTPFNFVTPEAEQAVERRSEKFQVIVGGKEVHCYAWGQGPNILFVHGWAGRGTQFRKFFEAVNHNGYRAVTFDGPAHGHSQGRSTNLDEFKATLFALHETVGEIVAIIAHSFGGVASLYAIMNGLPVRTLINIASPTIGDEIINSYRTAVNASAKMGEYFREYVRKKSGKTFDEFTSLYFIRHLSDKLNLLLIQDKLDKEVTLVHARRLQEVYPSAELIITDGLGHTRILKDDWVIQQCVTFIRDKASGGT
jgi:pimeloyl-ACP methyl ester carboxylesterase